MIDERIERAKWLLGHVRHAAMATVNADGTPHNTPYFFLRSDDLGELYWSSSTVSVHSKNIERTGEIFVVLYDAVVGGGGLYIKCQRAQIAGGEAFNRALAAMNKARAEKGKEPQTHKDYEEPGGQRLYVADTVAVWVNFAERDERGRIHADRRVEVDRNLLVR